MKKTDNTSKKEQNEKHPIVAIDLGSTSLRAMAATLNEDGTLHILGMEEIENNKNFVEKGIIVQTTDAGFDIKRILTQLRNRINYPDLDCAFVTIGGEVMQVCKVPVKRDQISRNYISDERLEEMRKECFMKVEQKYPDIRVVSAEPLRYILDGEEQTERPEENQKARKLEVHYIVFVASKRAVDNMEGGFGRANKAIEYQWGRPEAHVAALVHKEDEEAGCAIIDFGAQTTTLSIWKNEEFLHTCVYSFGGNDLTQAVQNDTFSFHVAEQLKIRFGYASPQFLKEDKILSVGTGREEEKRTELHLQELAAIIQNGLDEMLNPILQKIEKYHDNVGKIYITGGGARLKGMREYIRQQVALPVEFGTHADWLEEDAPDDYYLPAYSALIGTLVLGSEYRKRHTDILTPPPIGEGKLKGVLRKVEKTLEDLFTEKN